MEHSGVIRHGTGADALSKLSRLYCALEERQRQPPMRQIEPAGRTYDGPGERRLPETRRSGNARGDLSRAEVCPWGRVP